MNDPAHPGKVAAESAYTALGRLSRSIRTDGYRLIQHGDGGTIAETQLYDHDTDPLETVNLAGQHPELVKRLRQQMNGQDPQWAASQ